MRDFLGMVAIWTGVILTACIWLAGVLAPLALIITIIVLLIKHFG